PMTNSSRRQAVHDQPRTKHRVVAATRPNLATEKSSRYITARPRRPAHHRPEQWKRSVEVDAAVALGGRPDLHRPVTGRAQQVDGAERLVGRDHHHHADAEVEDLAHLVGVDLALTPDLAEDARLFPGAGVDSRVD